MRYIVFAREESSFPHYYAWMDKWCGFIQAHPVAIDLIGSWEKSTDGQPFVFHSYQEAADHLRELHPDIKLMWLDHRGRSVIGKCRHPKGDVAYFIGSDNDGFGDAKTSGTKVRLPMEGEFHAAIVLPMVITDRLVRG